MADEPTVTSTTTTTAFVPAQPAATQTVITIAPKHTLGAWLKAKWKQFVAFCEKQNAKKHL